MQPSRSIIRAVAMLSVAFSVAASGQERSALSSGPAQDAAAFGQEAAADTPFGAAAIRDRELSGIAGREDVNQLSYAEQVAGVSKNSVGENSITGNAHISDNAFQNMSGLSILNVNTGNNVAINASMNVNISFMAAQ